MSTDGGRGLPSAALTVLSWLPGTRAEAELLSGEGREALLEDASQDSSPALPSADGDFGAKPLPDGLFLATAGGRGPVLSLPFPSVSIGPPVEIRHGDLDPVP